MLYQTALWLAGMTAGYGISRGFVGSFTSTSDAATIAASILGAAGLISYAILSLRRS